MSHNVWRLEFYREDQAANYSHAHNTGALRRCPVDKPPRPVGEADPLSYGQIKYMIDVICMATIMMEHETQILFFLTEDSRIVARSSNAMPVGLRTPWKWVQPETREDLIQRLNDAADLAVPERERENCCKVAADFLVRTK